MNFGLPAKTIDKPSSQVDLIFYQQIDHTLTLVSLILIGIPVQLPLVQGEAINKVREGEIISVHLSRGLEMQLNIVCLGV